MSKSAKSASRRGPSGLIASIQFDKLLSDAAKRPTASKSAGVVGKWGTTSFTSLRSSHVNSIKAGASAVKASLTDNLSNHSQAATGNKSSIFSKANDTKADSVLKPRKFFKSRVADNQDSSNQHSNQHSFGMPTTDTGPSEFSQTYTSVDKNQQRNLDKYSLAGAPRVDATQIRPTRGRAKYSNFSVDPDEEVEPKKPRAGRKTKNKTIVSPQVPASQRMTRTKRKYEKLKLDESIEDQEDEFKPEPATTKSKSKTVNKRNVDLASVEPAILSSPEDPKPPIKLRIVRDKNAFVTTLPSDSCEKKPELVPSNGLTIKSLDTPVTNPMDVEEPESIEKIASSEMASDTDLQESSFKHQEKNDSETHRSPTPTLCESNGLEHHSALVESVATASIQQLQKKSTIFRSRTKVTEGNDGKVSSGKIEQSIGRKGLALYRHKWHEEDSKNSAEDANKPGTSDSKQPVDKKPEASFGWSDDSESIPTIPEFASSSFGRQGKYPTVDADDNFAEMADMQPPSLRKTKEYYTVVRNVKKAHQIQESGEFQEFNDDIDYILDALQDRNPTATRCLSAMSLASKCMEPAFRMHLRAHSTVAKFFQALKDAPSKASVALCTSCIMFVLTQDRLNMDLDRGSLELMLNLLETDIGQVEKAELKELEKNKSKVRELCEEMVRKGHGAHLELDNITPAQLAMETLLSLTSKKAGEWFKEELRVLGGLDHIIQTITACIAALTGSKDDGSWSWEKSQLDTLTKVDRCLRVLENVTFQNDENQNYLLRFSNGVLVDATLNLLTFISQEISFCCSNKPNLSVGELLGEALANLMKVVMNLTHDSSMESLGSKVYGENALTWDVVFRCLQETSNIVADEKKFDIMTLSLGILINLVERSVENQNRLMNKTILKASDGTMYYAVEALIEIFIDKETSARLEEAHTDEILDGKSANHSSTHVGENAVQDVAENAGSTASAKSGEDAMEETVKKLLHKAGRHMEDSMVAAYVSLLVGYLVMNNKAFEKQVKSLLPDQKFTLMIGVLRKFYEFLKLTTNAVIGTRGLKNTMSVIKYMEASDQADAGSQES